MSTTMMGHKIDTRKIDERIKVSGNEIHYDKPDHTPIIIYTKPLGSVRLEALLDALNKTQQELAESIGTTQPTISKIVDGRSKNSKYLKKIAETLGVSLNWLSGNDYYSTDSKEESNIIRIHNQDFLVVGIYQNEHNTAEPTENIGDSTIMIPSKMLHVKDPGALSYHYERERAMSPEIKPGDAVAFEMTKEDTFELQIQNGEFYVVDMGIGGLCTRMLFKEPDQTIKVRPKNPDFPEYTFSKENENFKIIGKVKIVLQQH